MITEEKEILLTAVSCLFKGVVENNSLVQFSQIMKASPEQKRLNKLYQSNAKEIKSAWYGSGKGTTCFSKKCIYMLTSGFYGKKFPILERYVKTMA